MKLNEIFADQPQGSDGSDSLEVAKRYIDLADQGETFEGTRFDLRGNVCVIHQDVDSEEPSKYIIRREDLPASMWQQLSNIAMQRLS